MRPQAFKEANQGLPRIHPHLHFCNKLWFRHLQSHVVLLCFSSLSILGPAVLSKMSDEPFIFTFESRNVKSFINAAVTKATGQFSAEGEAGDDQRGHVRCSHGTDGWHTGVNTAPSQGTAFSHWHNVEHKLIDALFYGRRLLGIMGTRGTFEWKQHRLLYHLCWKNEKKNHKSIQLIW